MLSPVYTPAPLPWLPLPRRSARGRRKNFPPRKTREEKAIAGFRDLFQHATEILQIPPRSHAVAAACVRWAKKRGEGTPQPALSATFHAHTGGGRRAPAQPRTGTAASHASLGAARRCAAKLQRDHNSNDLNEGDGSHLALSHPILPRPILQGAQGTSPPAAGERGGNGGAVGSRTSPARMPLTAPRRDAGMRSGENT